MKKSLLSAGVVCLSVLLGIGTAFAQMTNVVKVTLPVAVTVGTKTLPAGECTIQSLRDDGSASVLLIRAGDGTAVNAIAAKVPASKTTFTGETRVTLRNAGNTYQLDKIWLAGQQFGYELIAAN